MKKEEKKFSEKNEKIKKDVQKTETKTTEEQKETNRQIKKQQETEEITQQIKKQQETEEITQQIKKQQETEARNSNLKKQKKKEEKLEEIVKKTQTRKTAQGQEKNIAYMQQEEKALNYEYLFSYLGSGIRTAAEQYQYTGNKAIDENMTKKEMMDVKEQQEYATRQAVNFLLGTSMNHISPEEKIRFDAFMTDQSNKIVFLINYAMIGMNYKMPENAKITTNYASAQEIKMTDLEIKEKSIKNDIAISLRFDTKTRDIKEYTR